MKTRAVTLKNMAGDSWKHQLRPRTVKVYVSGGVVQNVKTPRGVSVLVYDHDIDGEPQRRLSRDDEGKLCIIGLWENEEQ